MKKLLFIVAFAFVFAPIFSVSASYTSGYFRSDGTYVNPYYRSNPNGLRYDNYSYRGDNLYNDSYYNSSYGSSWREPAWETQNNYWSGYNSYRNNTREYNSYLGY